MPHRVMLRCDQIHLMYINALDAYLVEPFYTQMIILPRQARDKHRESTQNRDAFLADFRLTPLNKERHFVAHSLICACFELGNAPQRDYGVDPAQEVCKNALFCRQCV